MLDSRVKRGGMQYLIKWAGKPRSENTWEPRSELIKENKNMLDKFHAEHPDAPRMPTITVPGGLRNPVVQAREIDYSKEWDRWNAVEQRWKDRKSKKQVVEKRNTNTISNLIFNIDTHIALDERLDIDKIWIYNTDIDKITHVAHVAAPKTENHHWHYPISSVHRVVIPFTYPQPINRNNVVNLHHDSVAIW